MSPPYPYLLPADAAHDVVGQLSVDVPTALGSRRADDDWDHDGFGALSRQEAMPSASCSASRRKSLGPNPRRCQRFTGRRYFSTFASANVLVSRILRKTYTNRRTEPATFGTSTRFGILRWICTKTPI